ncbi:hypothetical protein AB0C29_00285 [Actinoplanes sp. NPDC048791]|uniref:hypothetical protein n=1 Tax=Actinoplanes sp. NPDC048791 TaxID=3154623 RepID=UPI0033FCC2EB
MSRKRPAKPSRQDSTHISWGIEQLARADGKVWHEVLRPTILDTVQAPAKTNENIHQLDLSIQDMVTEYRRHRLPVEVISMGHWSVHQRNAVAFASCLVGHRAERLMQIGDLAANALICLEAGAVLPAAASARSALELSAMCHYLQRKLSGVWGRVHGDGEQIRQEVLGADMNLWKTLTRVRVGSDIIDSGVPEEWPRPVHVNDALRTIKKGGGLLAQETSATYARLCDAVHPSQGAQGAMWRLSEEGQQGPHRLLLHPKKSQTTSKVDIVAAVNISSQLVAEFARFLWWVAVDVSLAFRFKNVALNRSLGLPIGGALGAPCVCASGFSFRLCTHPRPSH